MPKWITASLLVEEIEQSLHELLATTPAAGLSAPSVHILNELYKDDGQHASELAQKIGRAATSFTPLLDKLQEAGLLLRRPDTQDRRAVRIYLTANGEALRKPITHALTEVEIWFEEIDWTPHVGSIDEPTNEAAEIPA